MGAWLDLIVHRNGMILPVGCENAQDTADAGEACGRRFALRHFNRNVSVVVATLPQRVGTFCLFRYPSPIGRHCADKRRPPIFVTRPKGVDLQQKIARIAFVLWKGFDWLASIGFNAPIKESAKRGGTKCRSNDSHSYCWWLLRGLPLAATHSHNKGLSAQAPVREPRLSSVAVSEQAWLLAQRATSPTVRQPKNANLNGRPFGGARFMPQQVIGALRAGGLFYDASMPPNLWLRTGGRDTYVR